MSFVTLQDPRQKPTSIALFRLGFRPFFLGAALLLGILMIAWVMTFLGHPLVSSLHGARWHGHEMLFGYTMAVIAGFLLTAVKNWTGRQTPQGPWLMFLFGLWLAARLLHWLPLPTLIPAIIDMAFAPALIMSLIPALKDAPLRNQAFLVMIGLLGLGNALSNLDALGMLPGARYVALYLALNIAILMIVVMGGRVIPFFTERPLGIQIKRRPRFDLVIIAFTVALVIGQLVAPKTPITQTLIWLNVIVHGLRLWFWYHPGIWRHPLIWVLHCAYGWLVIGLLLAGIAPWVPLNPFIALHALTVGCVISITLGMMARVSLGHTGRPLACSPWIMGSFVLLQLTALVRVFGAMLFADHYTAVIGISGTMAAAASLIFFAVYWPVLSAPRPDGSDG